MLVIRPVEMRDLNDLLSLANKVGKGMTSLPVSIDALSKKIQRSLDSFEGPASNLDEFFVVMEDTEVGKVVGTASVYARTGSKQAFYAYRVMPVTHYSHTLQKEVRSELLHLTNDYTGCSEVGSLFIDPDYRGNGRWLATSRYLLMGQFPQLFSSHVIAELRGVLDDNEQSPFWDAIGQHFFDMKYEDADKLCGTASNQFITELMPKHPIYTCLLPERAREVIGVPHTDSARAMSFLEAEGYDYENVVDIFDSGPILRAKIKNLHTIRNMVVKTAVTATQEVTGDIYFIANTTLKTFRVVSSAIALHDDNTIALPASVLDALKIQAGDSVSIIKK